MKAMMSSWWREFSFYSFWEAYREPDWDESDTNKPLNCLTTFLQNVNKKHDFTIWSVLLSSRIF